MGRWVCRAGWLVGWVRQVSEGGVRGAGQHGPGGDGASPANCIKFKYFIARGMFYEAPWPSVTGEPE